MHSGIVSSHFASGFLCCEKSEDKTASVERVGSLGLVQKTPFEIINLSEGHRISP